LRRIWLKNRGFGHGFIAFNSRLAPITPLTAFAAIAVTAAAFARLALLAFFLAFRARLNVGR
jgi:hypothetical protein